MINGNIYSVLFDRLSQLFVPRLMKRTKRMIISQALSKGLKNLYDDFYAYKDLALYQVSHNGSIIQLEKVLNDYFDPDQRRIYIENVQRVQDLRVYTLAAEKQINVSTTPVKGIRTGNDFNQNIADFNVYIPSDLQPIDSNALSQFIIQIKTQIDFYKLYAKKYELIWTN